MTTKAVDPLDDLPPMDSLDHVKARLEVICNRALHGQRELGPAVRACEAWVKADEHDLIRKRLREAEAVNVRMAAEIKRLRAELAKRGGLRVTA